MRKNIVIIESASENGAGKRGASLGPSALALESRAQGLCLFDDIEWTQSLEFNDFYNPNNENQHAKNAKSVYKAQDALCTHTEKVVKSGHFPLVLTGDHSNAIGAFSGLKNAFPDKRIGAIWVDAHYDLHSPYTSPSGNIHGMPLNALIGDDNREQECNEVSEFNKGYWENIKAIGSKQISPKISPKDIVFIQVRDFEKPEEHMAKKHNIRSFFPSEVSSKGITAVLEETLDYLSSCDMIYVSFDVDCQDTSISVGTGTPVHNGLNSEESQIVFDQLFNHPKVAAFEITEINPLLDTENKMAKAVLKLLSGVIN
ncbi:arginase [Bacteroidia bacterium]|nr:arginase [Bacteroidia bacterium]